MSAYTTGLPRPQSLGRPTCSVLRPSSRTLRIMYKARSVPVFSALMLLASVVGAGARDGELQRALREAECFDAAIRTVAETPRFTIYEANCQRSSHRIVTVTCTKQSCRADPENSDDGTPD